ncbi:MAG: RNA-binding S4 domain-containing protein [Candidatus Woesearchaeota archaeon]
MTKYIELNTFLRIHNVAPTGGQVKQLIGDEQVKVNGVVQTRNKRKLFASDKILFNNQEFMVVEEQCTKG